ncbi:hypothetical protein GCM10025771_24710 [Niveibacterium umoris]|uniref:Ice-binding protein C-terminal domain-containing protein n=1 Tax=Niveibacterium umoris TaxID=1193620 RepID=A0A840BFN5_9RHOO|nr:PEP-CTERM sorting domain-containing protein [Niveibacterium umoris]MBB4012341.1 hypothetical protein [Niveibacterium umoris]
MKSFKMGVLGACVALAFSGAASASLINVGGVIWDPDAATDYSSQSLNMRQFINTSTGELSGFGIIQAWNGTGPSSFCPGCEVTFQFGGYTPVGGVILPAVGQTVFYKSGWTKFYVGSGTDKDVANPFDYNALTWANTGNGTLFLDLLAHTDSTSGFTLTGTNVGGILLSGLGTFDVIGGLAASNFNTNTQADGADLGFTTSLSFKRGSVADVSGTGNLVGDSIPEPGTLTLLGAALLGAGLARRKVR